MRFIYNKEIYPKTVLVKAAYNYTDKFYIHLDQDEESYIVEIENKNNDCTDISQKEFDNEMLIQLARYEVLIHTKDIRKLILARSMASTIIDDNLEIFEETSDNDISDLLKDWFANE